MDPLETLNNTEFTGKQLEILQAKNSTINDLDCQKLELIRRLEEMEDMRNEAVNKAKDLENRCIQLQQMVNGQAAAMAKLTGQW